MTSHEYILQIFSGLVGLDDNLKPVPDIAQKWRVSDDGRTYTFYLRDDVRFHDG
ncbi:MAG: peptide ABC transporter substrate-binding protein, partial [Dehalococcoidales bacterium]|nr:peptide ABC transporter substrate-binding protein [Dehalococcoidales bacterium]